MVRRRKNSKMDRIDKLIKYTPENNENIEVLSEDTGFSFTEIQRKINNYFFSGEENLNEVFGELEEIDEDEDEEEEEED